MKIQFLPGYTGIENLKLIASIRGTTNIMRIRNTLVRVGLNPDDTRKFRKFSLGMKQRLGIAAAIMETPDLILLDEPTNALDEDGIMQICSLLQQERERGALIILACHDAAILRDLADIVYSISNGTVKELKAE